MVVKSEVIRNCGNHHSPREGPGSGRRNWNYGDTWEIAGPKKCGAESSDPNRHSQPRLPGSVV